MTESFEERKSRVTKEYDELLGKIKERNKGLSEALIGQARSDFRKYFEERGFKVEESPREIRAFSDKGEAVLSLEHQNLIGGGLRTLPFHSQGIGVNYQGRQYVVADWKPLGLPCVVMSEPIEVSRISHEEYKLQQMEREIEEMKRDLQRPPKIDACEFGFCNKIQGCKVELFAEHGFNTFYELLVVLIGV